MLIWLSKQLEIHILNITWLDDVQYQANSSKVPSSQKKQRATFSNILSPRQRPLVIVQFTAISVPIQANSSPFPIAVLH